MDSQIAVLINVCTDFNLSASSNSAKFVQNVT